LAWAGGSGRGVADDDARYTATSRGRRGNASDDGGVAIVFQFGKLEFRREPLADPSGDGVLVTAGGVMGAYALFVKDGTPAYEYNWFGLERHRVTSLEVLPMGKSTIRVEFKYDGGGTAKGGGVKCS
jgi:hypothetical protein